MTFRILPSKLGLSFVALGFFLYLASLQTHSGLLFILLGMLFGCYVINLVECRRSTASLSLTAPDSMTAREGGKLQGTWQIENPGKSDTGLVAVSGPWGPFFNIGSVAAQETLHITPEVSFPRRGVYPFTDLKLSSAYPFGLMSASKRVKCPGEIVVFPKVYPCTAPQAAGFEPMLGGRFSGKHKASTGDHFHGVRPMLPRDAVKMIHWPSSSKGQGLMVKEFDEELSGRVAVILGWQASANDAAEHPLDWAARAAGSLMLAGLDNGYQMEFVDLQSEKILTIPPFSDGSEFLDALARASDQQDSLSVGALERTTSRLPLRCSFAFVLTELPTEIQDFIHQCQAENRRVHVYLPNQCRQHELRVPVSYFTEESMVA